MTAARAHRATATVGLLIAAVAISVLGTACGGGGSDDAYVAEDLRSGQDVSLEGLRGEPVVLVSWATWCKECDEVLSGLQEFSSSEDAKGLEVVAVNLDAASVDDEIDAKIERHGLSTRLWRDRRNEFKRSFKALGVPTTVLLDRDGEVVATFPGAVDFDSAEVRSALEEIRSS